MKKTLLFMVAGAAILFTACNKEQEVNNPEENQENGPVYITANIDSETKATLANDSGAFAFSNGDAIMVCNESGAFSGITTSTGNSGTFAMEAGFNGSTDGIAGFPASMVTSLTKSKVTFTLPASYEYNEVGSGDPVAISDAEANSNAANAAKVPCPMIGSYDGETKKVTLKQAGAVVRFRITKVAAGSLTITFPTDVTGEVDLSVVPSGKEDGILATNLKVVPPYKYPGAAITINNVPDVDEDEYIYITIPVPTKTAPENILVSNTPSVGAQSSRMVAISGSEKELSRAGGYKLSASLQEVPNPTFKVAADRRVVFAPGNLMAKIKTLTPVYNTPKNKIYWWSYAEADEWKFGGYLESIGGGAESGNYLFSTHDDTCEGKWVDLFMWQGTNTSYKAHGLISVNDNILSDGTARLNWLGDDDNNTSDEGEHVTLYSGCWDTYEGNVEHEGYINISNGGNYTWRTLSSTEWIYLLSQRSTTGLPDHDNARFARVKVAGVCGLLIFPDDVYTAWNTSTMGSYPNDINGTTVGFQWEDASAYSAFNLFAMVNAGFAFLPAAGVRQSSGVNGTNVEGHYWSSTSVYNSGATGTGSRALYVEFKRSTAPNTGMGGKGGLGGYYRTWGRSVRLVRDLPAE